MEVTGNAPFVTKIDPQRHLVKANKVKSNDQCYPHLGSKKHTEVNQT